MLSLDLRSARCLAQEKRPVRFVESLAQWLTGIEHQTQVGLYIRLTDRSTTHPAIASSAPSLRRCQRSLC